MYGILFTDNAILQIVAFFIIEIFEKPLKLSEDKSYNLVITMKYGLTSFISLKGH